MIVCINQNKIQKCKTGNLERRVRAELTLNVGDVASPTWTWRWCIVSGCLVFCHFLVNKFVIRNADAEEVTNIRSEYWGHEK